MKKPKLKIVAALAIAACAGTTAWAGDLKSELIYLRENNPLLRATTFAVGAAEEREGAATAGWFPKLSVSADGGREKIVSTSNSGGVLTAVPTDLHRQKKGVTLEQNVFNGGRTLATSNIAKIEGDIKRADQRATSQEVLLEAMVAYLQVLKNHMLISLSAINEETTQKQLFLEKMRVEKGGGIAVDELQAETRLQVVRERRVVYEQGMRDALASYEQVFGKAPEMDKFQDVSSFMKLMPADLEAAMDVGLQNNPRLVASKLAADKASKVISLERSSFMPSFDVAVTHNRDNNAAGLYKKDEDSVLMKMSWNLFSGGETFKRTQAAVFDQKEATERELNARNKTREAVRMAWNQYQKGVERVELLENATKTSRAVMNGRKKLRDAGKETALAVLDAEVEHFGVLANKVNAMIDARIGSYRLLSTIGMLNINQLNIDGDQIELPVRSVDVAIKQLLNDEVTK
ncbi:MAG: TolC family protein [Limnohabitans sp.]